MYWKNQEEIIFYIILFILIAFQASSAIVLHDTRSILAPHMLVLVGLNVVLLSAMILYAKCGSGRD